VSESVAALPPDAAPNGGARRQLGLRGAVGLGIGSMLGAGVFSVWGPAAASAGKYLLAAVAVAALVAVCNALSTAALAARHPRAGGVYAYGRAEVSPAAGYIAGLGFVIGKTASLAAMGLTIGAYAWPGHEPEVATAALVVAWIINARGVTRTAFVASVVGGVVLVSLAVFVAAGWSQPAGPTQAPPPPATWWEPLVQVGGGAAIIFFAFAGYARIATLGEEVREPARVIPRAVAIAVSVVLVAYSLVAVSVMHRPGLASLPESTAPIAELVSGSLVPVAAVSVVAVMAAFGAMVALAAGVGRTAMAMARERDMPAFLAREGTRGVPWLAEGVSILVAIALAWWGDLGLALAMSSFAIVTYYAIANYAALRSYARPGDKTPRVARWVARIGLVGCVALALSLPVTAALLATGLGVVALLARWLGGWWRTSRRAFSREAR
jgi:APA family basic amino acid/polyamine antiporter